MDRIIAVIVDGRKYNFTDHHVDELSGLLPEELQRIESMGGESRRVVLVVYTREFMKELVARGAGKVHP